MEPLKSGEGWGPTKRVKFMVGESDIHTSWATLGKEPLSKLAEAPRFFDWEEATDTYLIDRPQTHFQALLNFYRDDMLPVDADDETRDIMLREARYYGLTQLYNSIRGFVALPASIGNGQFHLTGTDVCIQSVDGLRSHCAGGGTFSVTARLILLEPPPPPQNTGLICFGDLPLLTLTHDRRLIFRLGSGDSMTEVASPPDTFPTGEWTTISAVRDFHMIVVYINTNSWYKPTPDPGIGSDQTQSEGGGRPSEVMIGAPPSHGDMVGFCARITGVEVHFRALTCSEIGDIYTPDGEDEEGASRKRKPRQQGGWRAGSAPAAVPPVGSIAIGAAGDWGTLMEGGSEQAAFTPAPPEMEDDL